MRLFKILKIDRILVWATALPDAILFRASLRFKRLFSNSTLILVERANALGDVICTFPAVLALRHKFPDAFIVYRTSGAYVPIVQMSNCADAVVDFKQETRVGKIKKCDFDLVFNPTYSCERDEPAPKIHLAQEFCEQLGVESENLQPKVYLPAPLVTLAKLKLNLQCNEKLIIGCHVGPTWGVRTWPKKSWDELSQMLIKKLDCRVIQFGSETGPNPGGPGGFRIDGAEDWVGRTPISEGAACISLCDLFIGVDSGLIHLSGAVGVPTLGIFGPTDPSRRLPTQTSSDSAVAELDCLGCHHRQPRLHCYTTCIHGVKCMNHVTPKAVFEKAVKLLADRIGSFEKSTE